jgi:hypothetical protein
MYGRLHHVHYLYHLVLVYFSHHLLKSHAQCHHSYHAINNIILQFFSDSRNTLDTQTALTHQVCHVDSYVKCSRKYINYLQWNCQVNILTMLVCYA